MPFLVAVAAMAMAMLATASRPSGGDVPCAPTADISSITHGFNMSGKVVVITGGAGGLGSAATRGFAERGATVVIADWNRTAGENAVKSIPGDVRYLYVDLSSLAATRAFVGNFTAAVGKDVSILINNAAGPGATNVSTADGFVEMFEINYLAPFLLTELLLPGMRRAAKASGSASRIINIASDVHRNACEGAGWERDCFKDWKYLPLPALPPAKTTIHFAGFTDHTTTSYYGATKFLQIQHAAELAVREKDNNVLAFSLHPGSCLASWHPPPSTWDKICNKEYPQKAPQPCPYSVQQGTSVYAYVALHNAISGSYYSRVTGCTPNTPVMHGFTDAMRPQLYQKSLRWAGLAAP